MFKCLNSLRETIFGDKQLAIAVKGMQCNFTSENLNIGLPIFTIHGNHDYPSNDFGKISVCDLLHASSYVNYFGKFSHFAVPSSKTVTVKPLIFRKKGAEDGGMLAIYGLGYVKDFKLHKMLIDKLVCFEEPPQPENTTCILIIHQNRYKKKGGVGASFENCIHAEQLPNWMDLVIWGH